MSIETAIEDLTTQTSALLASVMVAKATLDTKVAAAAASAARAAAAVIASNPMTATGDLIVGGLSGATTRKAIGTNGQVLSVVGGLPAWTTPAATSGGGTGSPGLSAYQIAVENGFVGTSAQWLTSLQTEAIAAINFIPTYSIVASEDLAEGMLVNVYNNAGAARIRKATCSVSGASAHGFVKSNYTLGQLAIVHFTGVNDKCMGLTIGDQYLSSTPGISSSTMPVGNGQTLQTVGLAISSTILLFNPSDAALLA